MLYLDVILLWVISLCELIDGESLVILVMHEPRWLIGRDCEQGSRVVFAVWLLRKTVSTGSFALLAD